MPNNTIAFIGAGNMAAALINGLIADGTDNQDIIASDPDTEKCQALSAQLGIRIIQDNAEAIAKADVVVLAVKPQILQQVAESSKNVIQKHQPLIISIAAGVRSDTLNTWLGGNATLVRTMPNTPAMLQSGATGLYATNNVSEDQRATAESVMRAVGITQWVTEESEIDAVTALSGSGPAYYFLMMEAMENAARELGLSPETAHLLTLQTALGAARMAMESSDDPATLRAKVTSPGGTTEQAINSFENDKLREIVSRALHAARDRSIELSDQLGK